MKQLNKESIAKLKKNDKVFLTDTSSFPNGEIRIKENNKDFISYKYLNPQDPSMSEVFEFEKQHIKRDGSCGDCTGKEWIHLYIKNTLF